MTRQEKVSVLTEHYMRETPKYTVQEILFDLLNDGFKGFRNMTDAEIDTAFSYLDLSDQNLDRIFDYEGGEQ